MRRNQWIGSPKPAILIHRALHDATTVDLHEHYSIHEEDKKDKPQGNWHVPSVGVALRYLNLTVRTQGDGWHPLKCNGESESTSRPVWVLVINDNSLKGLTRMNESTFKW